jgi:tetratricopeptide (TPR) repeat protein
MQEAVELEPDNAYYQISLGGMQFRQFKHEKALVHFKKATELEPDNAEYHYFLGFAYYWMVHKYDECIKETQKTIDLGKR